MYIIVCSHRGSGSIPSRDEVLQGITLSQPILTHAAWQKKAQSFLHGTTQPVDIEQEDLYVQPQTMLPRLIISRVTSLFLPLAHLPSFLPSAVYCQCNFH